jgi:inner membrane protein
MATVGHLAVGLLAGRLHRGCPGQPQSGATLAAFALLAVLPDADVVLVALGAHDGGVAGHRGASHSIALAVAVGILCAVATRRLRWPVWRTAILATFAVASHAVLDFLGHGGRGLPLLWPLSEARFQSPLRIFPDAPRGLALVTSAGVVTMIVELVVFLPVIVYALWPHLRRRRPTTQPQLTVIAGGATATDPAVGVAPAAPGSANREHAPEREPPIRSSG